MLYFDIYSTGKSDKADCNSTERDYETAWSWRCGRSNVRMTISLFNFIIVGLYRAYIKTMQK
jgi:hypothetical protein